MPLRKRKPTSPARRFQSVSDFKEITSTSPEKSLLEPNPKSGGRNSYGRKTSRHRGGGHKQQYRVIDFKRNKDGVPAKVATIEYDPNRNCRIALLHFADGEKRYILAAKNLNVGDTLQNGQGAEIRPGNALPMRYIPVGTVIHNVELYPGAGGKMARSAGASVQLVAKEGLFATLAPAQLGDASGADRLPRHGGRSRQLRVRAHQDREGRPQPLARQAPADTRRGHEPGRPPPWWWRRKDLRWTASRLPVGQAGGPHTCPPKGFRLDDHPAAPWARGPEVGRHATQP